MPSLQPHVPRFKNNSQLLCSLHPSTSSKHYIVQHTQCPCRFVILLIATKKAPYSHKLRGRHTEYTSIHIRKKDNRYVHTYHVHGILMLVASVGCFPGAWRRGSWHFQVASLHLQSSTDLLFVRLTLIFLPEQALWAAYAARGAKRLVPCTAVYSRRIIPTHGPYYVQRASFRGRHTPPATLDKKRKIV